jgi:cyclic pyranopterin phosphate synthase
MARSAPVSKLSHLNRDGGARMVDVGDKPATSRTAVASASVRIGKKLREHVKAGSMSKGDVLAVARLAGIMAAKRTSELIPLCHALPLDAVDVSLTLAGSRMTVRATVRTTARTGVEMEALVAASVAALTFYDMCKSMDRGMVIEHVQLEEKRGGKSGVYRRKRGAHDE